MKNLSKIKALAASFLLLGTPVMMAAQAPAAPQQAAAPMSMPVHPDDTVHPIMFRSEPSAELAKKYSFIADYLKPFDGDPTIVEPPPPFPEYVKIAEISIPEKNLTFVALLVEGHGWCDNDGICNLSFHFLRENGEYEQLAAMFNAEISSYYITNKDSFSVVFCENKQFQRWQLKDGALSGPMPMDQNGYFTYEGVYSNADMKNTCPPLSPPAP